MTQSKEAAIRPTLITFRLESRSARCLLATGGVAVALVLAALVLVDAVSRTLAGMPAGVSPDEVGRFAAGLPESAAVNAKLARLEFEAMPARLESARRHAERAVALAPESYRYRLLSATVAEAQGDHVSAEQALRSAVALAPFRSDARWQLANCLLRAGRAPEAADAFREASVLDPALQRGGVSSVWRATGDLDLARRACVAGPESLLVLASLLADEGRFADAASVMSGLDPSTLRSSSVPATVVSGLLAAADVGTARELWLRTAGALETSQSLLWDGGFDRDPAVSPGPFGWRLAPSDHAWVGVDASAGRSAPPALAVRFAGRDTTRLAGEVSQLIAVRSGARYRIEFWVRADALVTPEGPRVTVSAPNGGLVAQSSPIPEGTSDWRLGTLEFDVPANTSVVVLALHRTPRFSYDEPTTGTLWLDDFAIAEVASAR